MKTEIKYTRDYVLLVDLNKDIVEGTYYLTNFGNVYRNTERIFADEEDENEPRSNSRNIYFPVVAYKKLNPQTKDLDLPLLPEFEDDIFKLAEDYSNKTNKYPDELYPHCDQTLKEVTIDDFIAGYKAAQSSNKQFSLEDMKKAFGYYAFTSISNQPYNDIELEQEFNQFIQSLSTQQLPVSFELKYRYYYHSSKEFYSDSGFVECSKEQYESIKPKIHRAPKKLN